MALTIAQAKALARRYISKDGTLTNTEITSLAEYIGLASQAHDLIDNASMGFDASALGRGADYYNDMVYNAAINAGIYTTESESAIQTPLSKTYSFLDYTNDVVQTQASITEGIFPGGIGTLATFYTSSAQSSVSEDYYLTVANGTGSDDTTLFDIAHLVSGSILSASENVMYKGISNLLLSGSSKQFNIDDAESTNVFALSFKRALYKEQLDPGNWEIIHSGKHYIDDSEENSGATTLTGKRYNVVSGSADDGIYSSTPVGLFYPNMGTIIFNTSDLSGSNTTNLEYFDNIQSISARSKQVLKENNYFCRIRNKEYNYTNNPTFLSSSGTGEYIYATFKNNPKVFPTTVGLYNDNNELLATAKLSKPFKKAFDTEMVVKVKLSF